MDLLKMRYLIYLLIIVIVAGTVYSQSNNLNLKNRLTINNSIDLPKDIWWKNILLKLTIQFLSSYRFFYL